MAINYWRVGRKAAAWSSLSSELLRRSHYSRSSPCCRASSTRFRTFSISPLNSMRPFLANGLQSRIIEEHLASGGKVASPGRPSGSVALLARRPRHCLAQPFVFQTVVWNRRQVPEMTRSTMQETRPQPTQTNGRRSQRESSTLEGTNGLSAHDSNRHPEKYAVSFVVVADAWKVPKYVEAFREIGREIVTSGFPSPLKVQLCNDEFEIMETIVID